MKYISMFCLQNGTTNSLQISCFAAFCCWLGKVKFKATSAQLGLEVRLTRTKKTLILVAYDFDWRPVSSSTMAAHALYFNNHCITAYWPFTDSESLILCRQVQLALPS